MLGLGEPRSVRAGVVGGSYFEVMGLRPVLGRLIGPQDDGRNAEGVAVLTYRFWTSAFKSDPGVIGKIIRLSDRPATVVGVLEPSVPYPQETEIIANVVTSPHHLDATMVDGRVHRMTELFGRLAPGVDLDAARAELRAVHGAIVKEHPEAYQTQADFRIDGEEPARPDHLAGEDDPADSAGGLRPRLHRRVLERRESDSGPVGAASGRTGACAPRLAPAPARSDGRSWPRVCCSAARARCSPSRSRGPWWPCSRATRRASRFARTTSRWTRACSGSAPGSPSRRRCCWPTCPKLPSADGVNGTGARERRRAHHVGHEPAPARVRRHADRGVVRARRGRGDAHHDALRAAAPADRLHGQRARGERPGRVVHAKAGGGQQVLQGGHPPHLASCRASNASRSARSSRGGIPASLPRSSRSRAIRRPTAKRIRARGSGPCRRDSSTRSGVRTDRRTRLQRGRSAATARRSSSSARASPSGCSRAWTP